MFLNPCESILCKYTNISCLWVFGLLQIFLYLRLVKKSIENIKSKGEGSIHFLHTNRSSTPSRTSPPKFSFIHYNEQTTRAINTDGHKRLWLFFSTLKRELGAKDWIHHEEIKDISKKIPYSAKYTRLWLKDLVKHGYAHETRKGYGLKSVRKVAFEKFGVNTKHGYTYVSAETKKELNARVAFLVITNNMKQQVHAYEEKNQLNPKAGKGRKYQLAHERFSLSVRNISKKLGFKSGMTGTNILRELERVGLVKVDRFVDRVCHVCEYKALCKAEPELQSKCFLSGEEVFIRRRSNIIIQGF